MRDTSSLSTSPSTPVWTDPVNRRAQTSTGVEKAVHDAASPRIPSMCMRCAPDVRNARCPVGKHSHPGDSGVDDERPSPAGVPRLRLGPRPVHTSIMGSDLHGWRFSTRSTAPMTMTRPRAMVLGASMTEGGRTTGPATGPTSGTAGGPRMTSTPPGSGQSVQDWPATVSVGAPASPAHGRTASRRCDGLRALSRAMTCDRSKDGTS